MKKLAYLFVFAATSIFLNSCGSGAACTADDWVGTWTGQSSCDDGTTDMATVTVTKKDEVTIIFNNDGQDFEVRVSGCSFSLSESVESIFGPVEVSLQSDLDGDNIMLITDATILGQTINCDINLARQ